MSPRSTSWRISTASSVSFEIGGATARLPRTGAFDTGPATASAEDRPNMPRDSLIRALRWRRNACLQCTPSMGRVDLDWSRRYDPQLLRLLLCLHAFGAPNEY